MKRVKLYAALAIMALLFASCGKNDYKSFVGTWGVEKIEYYNIDYAGNPIAASMSTYNMVPGDQQSGIDLIFREDKSGEMRDRSQDTLIIKVAGSNPVTYDTIICPDTTLVTRFTYSYDKTESILYMNMDYVHTYKMNITSFSKDAFIYENEYGPDYVEKAYLKRISNTPAKSSSRSATVKPNKPGSFLGSR